MHTFIMLFDDKTTPTLEAVMASGMSQRFPACDFRAERTRNPEYADMILPVANTKSNGDELGSFSVHPPPAELTDDVHEAFNTMLREAREVKPS